MIRKEAWPFYRTMSGVRLSWELEEPHGTKGSGAKRDPKAQMLSLQSFLPKGVSLGDLGLNQNLKDLKERKHDLSTKTIPVSAYGGSSKNLKDLKV